ncbi:MAG: ABC transporter ATP-binding protein [Planctomycetes bacterium]|nr:ABC transporter ATP-binding protein [Planctomycetota bacterium]
MPAIEIIDLTKKFGDTVAVNRLNLAIEEGVFFTFLGPNGAGKTTTMKLMAGLLQPTGGTVRIHGIDIGVDPVAAKAFIGYIPDHPFLYGKLTGWEFLNFIGGLYRMPRREIQEEGQRLLDIFGLNGQSDRLIETYSHGMRQRLAFTACFLHRPRVVIIDEPWVGLDPHNIRAAIAFLRQRAREGTTIFMSTHSLDIAEEIAERIGILHRGQLIFEGQTSTLRASSSKDLEEAFLELTAEEETLGGGS